MRDHQETGASTHCNSKANDDHLDMTSPCGSLTMRRGGTVSMERSEEDKPLAGVASALHNDPLEPENVDMYRASKAAFKPFKRLEMDLILISL